MCIAWNLSRRRMFKGTSSDRAGPEEFVDTRLPDCHHRHSNPGLAAWAAPSRTLTIRERLAELRQLGHDLLDELDVDDRTCAHRQVVPELGFRRVRPLAEDVSSDAT